MPRRPDPSESSPFLRVKLPTRGIEVHLRGYPDTTVVSNLDWTDLRDWLTEHFVPYVECDRKCTATDVCPYTVKDPVRPERLKEIKCGYQVHSITQYLRHGLVQYKPRRKQDMALLIDGCLAAKEYLFEAFTGACMVIDGAFLRWIAPRLPEHACYSGAQIASSIQQLREASRRLGIAPVEPVDLFVEGNSELVVLEAAIGNAFHRDVNIIDMGGNTKLAWLRPRLELTRKQHRTAALILDRASRDIQNKVDALVAEGLLERDNVRFLPGDFEDIFEEELLLSVARRTLPEGMLAPTVDAIRDGEERRRQGFSRCLKKKALARGIDAGRMDSFVSSVKARMAEGIAEVVVESYHSFRQALTWRKGPRSARLRLVGFVHLCRWILKLAGKEARRKYLAASTS